MSDLAPSNVASKASSFSNANSAGTNVQVAVRCRPSNAEEKKTNQPTVITCDSENKSLKVSFGPAGKKISKAYTFDKVFGMYSTQEEVFESIVRPIVDEALAGFNCTIFAYGQTGTGKTHTMEGNIHSEEHAGIVPRSVKAILEQLEASDSEYTIRVSFLELYNEELQDLLNTSGDRKLKLCEDIKKGVVCQNLEEITVLNAGDIFEILQKGIQQRQTAETLMNKNSSRSHSIFTMKIMIKECNVDGEEVVRHGQLNLVDLAGSECIGRSGAKNDRAREAGSINQSLLTLGRVITALVDHHGHIPYRDSKLTRLLQESLGGKAKTVIIATLSPSQLAVEETMSTLDYAHRAKNIKNQPTVNQRMTKKVVLKEYCAEIEMLKSQLQITREKNGVYVNPEDYYATEARIQTQESQILECEAALKTRNEELKTLRSDNTDLIDKNETLDLSLQASIENALSLKGQLSVSETELEISKGDLAATEAVVKEQVVTESTLHVQGEGLQGEVLGRRDDVTKLLEKVARYSEKEIIRAKQSADMAHAIAAHTVTLQTGISNMTAGSKENSTVLCAGVCEMLTRSRTTCTSLKASIDGALTTLIGDAVTAKDCMTKSCDTLQKDLESTNNHVEVTLQCLQENLSKWLGEVDSSMKEAQQLLIKQNNQLEGFSSTLLSQAANYTEMNKRFLNKLDIDFENASKNSAALQEELESLFVSFSDNIQLEVEQTKNEMNSKASAIEEAMSKMLKEMVSSTNSSLAVTSSSVSNFATNSKKTSKRGFSNLEKQISSIATHSRAESKAITIQIENNSAAQALELSSLEQLRANTNLVLDGISGDVGKKRATLDKTVTSLVKDVAADVKKACSAVQDTSNTANIILKDVVTATKTMTSSSNDALNNFETFINKEGQVVNDSLGSHFEVLEKHLHAQNDLVVSVSERSSKYGDAAKELLGSTGSTPKKCGFRPLGSLMRTRAHDVIRAECKSGVVGKETVALSGISDVHIEKIEEVSPPIADRSISVVEGIDDAMRLSCLTILSSESSDTHDESEHSENANPNTIPSLNSSIGSQKSSNVSKISRIGRPKGAKAMI